MRIQLKGIAIVALGALLFLGFGAARARPVAVGNMPDRGDTGGVAWVAEDLDADDSGRTSGLFTAHWESDDGRDYREGPESVPLDTALSWARAGSAYVLLRFPYEPDVFSAGRLMAAQYTKQRWSGGNVRPRPVGTPRDGAVQEREWIASVVVDSRGHRLPDLDLETLRRVEPGIESADVRRRTADSYRVRCSIRSKGGKTAVVALDRAFDAMLAGQGVPFEDRGVEVDLDEGDGGGSAQSN